MRNTSNLRGWQKGIAIGFIFIAALSAFYTAALIFLDLRLAKAGAPHMCFAFTESVICSFEEAIYSRLGFMILLILVFGIPAALIGALIGFMIEKTTIR